MNAKPSEIRAASKAGRIAIKADWQKQQRMLKEQQESQMKMNKIRAEIEAIKEKERSINGERSRNASSELSTGNTTSNTSNNDTDGEILQRDNESAQSQDSNKIYNDQLNASMTKIATAKNGSPPPHRMIRRNKSSKQFERALSSKETLLISNPVLEMRPKVSVRDLVFSLSDHQGDLSKVIPSPLITPKGERKMSRSQENPMVFVQREHVIATTKASFTDKNQLAHSEEEKRKIDAQRNKLDEAKRCFEEGHRLCWKFQDSHSALGEYRKALFIFEGLLGKYHEDTGKTYYWVGQSLVKIEECDEALVAFSRALRIFYRVLAKNHKYRKWTDTAISEIFHDMDDPDDYNSYKAALDDSISREVAGDRFRKEKLFSQAISEYRAAIEFLQGYHPDSADLHSKIAIILRRMGEFDKALEENRFALEIYELSLGPEHPETVKTLNRTMERKRFNQLS